MSGTVARVSGLAVSLAPSGLSFRDNVAYAKEAESLGYDSAWVPEVGGNDAFALGAAVGLGTDRLRIGTGVPAALSHYHAKVVPTSYEKRTTVSSRYRDSDRPTEREVAGLEGVRAQLAGTVREWRLPGTAAEPYRPIDAYAAHSDRRWFR